MEDKSEKEVDSFSSSTNVKKPTNESRSQKRDENAKHMLSNSDDVDHSLLELLEKKKISQRKHATIAGSHVGASSYVSTASIWGPMEKPPQKMVSLEERSRKSFHSETGSIQYSFNEYTDSNEDSEQNNKVQAELNVCEEAIDVVDDVIVSIEAILLKFPKMDIKKSGEDSKQEILKLAGELKENVEQLSAHPKQPMMELHKMSSKSTSIVEIVLKLKESILSLCCFIPKALIRQNLLNHFKHLSISLQDYMSSYVAIIENELSTAKILLNVKLYISESVEHVTTVLVPVKQTVQDVTKFLCQKQRLNPSEYQLRSGDFRTPLPMNNTIDSVDITSLSLWRLDDIAPRKSLLNKFKLWKQQSSVRETSPQRFDADQKFPTDSEKLRSAVIKSSASLEQHLDSLIKICKQLDIQELKKWSLAETDGKKKMRPRLYSWDDKAGKGGEEESNNKKKNKKKKKIPVPDAELTEFCKNLSGALLEWYEPLAQLVGSENPEVPSQSRPPRNFTDKWFTDSERELRHKLHKKCKYLVRRLIEEQIESSDFSPAEKTYPRNQVDWKWQLPILDHLSSPPPPSSKREIWDLSSCKDEQMMELKTNIKKIDALEILGLRQSSRYLSELDGETTLFGVLGLALPKGVDLEIQKNFSGEASNITWTIQQKMRVKYSESPEAQWEKIEEKLQSAGLSARSLEKLRQSKKKQTEGYIRQRKLQYISGMHLLSQLGHPDASVSERQAIPDAIKLLDTLKEERVVALGTLESLENPMTCLRKCYISGKITLFFELVKAHLLNHIIVYDAITLGTLTRNRDFFLKSSSVLKSLDATFIPTAANGVYGPSYSLLRSDLYFDEECRRRVSRISTFFDRTIRSCGLEEDMDYSDSRTFLCNIVAAVMTYRFSSQILVLSSASLYRFARIAVGMMMHGLLYFSDHEFNKYTKADTISLISFLIHNTCRQPEWAVRKNMSLDDHYYFRLATEEGNYFSALVLMRLSGILCEDGTSYLPILSEKFGIPENKNKDKDESEENKEQSISLYHFGTHSEVAFLCQLLSCDFEMASPRSKINLDYTSKFRVNGQSLMMSASERELELLQACRIAKQFLIANYVTLWDILESQLAI